MTNDQKAGAAQESAEDQALRIASEIYFASDTREYILEFARRLRAEWGKDQEPVAWRSIQRIITDEYVAVYHDDSIGPCPPSGDGWTPLFEHAAPIAKEPAPQEPFGYWDHFNEVLYRGDDAGTAASVSAAEGGNKITPLYAAPVAKAPVAQAGMVSVPIEPTEEMLLAMEGFGEYDYIPYSGESWRDFQRACWKMILLAVAKEPQK